MTSANWFSHENDSHPCHDVWKNLELCSVEMSRTPQHRKFVKRSLVSLPKTPIKSATVNKDENCLLCGINFKISGHNAWHSMSGDLRAQICSLLSTTPDFSKESKRVCKKCCRKTLSMIKKL